MTFDIPPDKVQQLVEEQFTGLHAQLDAVKSTEEKIRLLSDAKRYVLGLLDFYSCATPSAMPALARTEGQVDDDVVIQTILDTALHTIQQLEEQ